jgi:hypothetical protein
MLRLYFYSVVYLLLFGTLNNITEQTKNKTNPTFLTQVPSNLNAIKEQCSAFKVVSRRVIDA